MVVLHELIQFRITLRGPDCFSLRKMFEINPVGFGWHSSITLFAKNYFISAEAICTSSDDVLSGFGKECC